MPIRYLHPIDNVLSRLDGVQETTSGWIALCPSHGDTCPSLSVGIGRDDRVLLYCHSGCGIEHILPAIGLEVRDLFFQLPMGDRTDVCEKRIANPAIVSTTPPTESIDFGPLMHTLAKALIPELRIAFARHLGLDSTVLNNFLLGWGFDQTGVYWAIPEWNADGKVVGILRRYLDGEKRTYSGSRRGLVLPYQWPSYSGPLAIVEGFSDTATLIACGIPAVGRPSASGGGDALVALLRRFGRDPLVIGENDEKPNGLWPGWNGALAISRHLSMCFNKPVPLLMPPANAKDVRALYLQGGAKAVQDWLTQSATYQINPPLNRNMGERDATR